MKRMANWLIASSILLVWLFACLLTPAMTLAEPPAGLHGGPGAQGSRGTGRPPPSETLPEVGGMDREIEGLRKRRESRKPEIPSLFKWNESELSRAQKKLLSPAPEDVTRFADFLKQPDTGLIRLLPKGKYEFNGTVSAADPEMQHVVPLPGGGAAYSFTKKTHVQNAWSELLLENNVLRSGFAGEVLGVLINLGDTPLESVSLASAGIDYLSRLAVPGQYADAVRQSRQNAKGFQVAGQIYRSDLPALPDMTYVLRSTANRRADFIVAFRVIRRDSDGSLILLWKRLKKYQTPNIKKAASL